MATSTTMMYTLLPSGGNSDPFTLSIFLSPRLEDPSGIEGLLSDYALGNWAQQLKTHLTNDPTLTVELGVQGGPQILATATPQYVAGLDPVLWDDMFPPNQTGVKPRVFKDHSKRWIRSYPMQAVETYIQKLYNQIANEYPDGFPDLLGQTAVTELIDVIEAAKPIIDGALPPVREPDLPKRYQPVPQRGRATHPEADIENRLVEVAAQFNPDIPLAAIFQAIRFFKRGNQGPYQSKDNPYDPDSFRDRPVEPRFDFNEAVTALGDYPFLLRKLGLVVECTLVGGADLVAGNQLRLLPPTVGSVPPLVPGPWTVYEIDSDVGFRPRPRPGGDVEKMMLRLDNGAYSLVQTDPDGNVIKVYDYAVNMAHKRSIVQAQRANNPGAKINQGPEEASLPALRHGGVMVVRDARDDKLWDTVAMQANFEGAPGNAQMYADELLRGYRVDVHDGSQWFSLMRRRGQYDVSGNSVIQPTPDEGYLKAESATSDDEQPVMGDPEPDLYTHGAVINWTNWSLAASVPGKAIIPKVDEDKHQTEVPELRQNEPGGGFDFAANFKPEQKSLPALRFGQTYNFRARATLLDGGSLAPPPSHLFPTPSSDQPPAGVGVSEPLTYRRFDPVPAPMLILSQPVTEGESMEELVIRSRGGVGTPEPLPVQFDELAIFNPENPRWVAPPKAHVVTLELHGQFDNLFNQPPNVSRDILAKESGTFDNLKLGDPMPGAHVATIVDETGAELDPDVVLPNDWVQGDPLPNNMWYFIRKDDPLPLPYLPDPLAHGAMFMYSLNGNKLFHHQPYVDNAWHDREPFKLVLKGNAGPDPNFVTGGPEVEALLPPGTMLTVKYSSAVVPPGGNPGPGELELMGRWHGMSDEGRNNTADNGYQHWMLTPYRTAKLVHAVEKPLQEPRFSNLNIAYRNPGETFVRLHNGQTELHSESTGEIEVRARWQDWVDDPSSDPNEPGGMPHLADRDGHVLDEQVFYGEQPVIGDLKQKDEFAKHELGDTRHRWVHYYLVGTSRYREYFSHEFTDYEELNPHPLYPDIIRKEKLINSFGPEYLKPSGEPLNVLSSARPIVPDVKYLVPTFQWQETASGRRRLGRGLRVYLSRPWCSTGVDELLGVVMMPTSFSGSDETELRRYITEWGSDPIFDRSGPLNYLAPNDFDSSIAGTTGENLRLAETYNQSNLEVQVFGVEPQFDAQRNLWFADLVLGPPDQYYSFVRFAFCRYQPHSIFGHELSRVVRTEFAQLLADRTAALLHQSQSIDITLYGPSGI